MSNSLVKHFQHVFETFANRMQTICKPYAKRMQNIFYTYSKRLQTIFKTYAKRIQNACKAHAQLPSAQRLRNVFETSSKQLARCYIGSSLLQVSVYRAPRSSTCHTSLLQLCHLCPFPMRSLPWRGATKTGAGGTSARPGPQPLFSSLRRSQCCRWKLRQFSRVFGLQMAVLPPC